MFDSQGKGLGGRIDLDADNVDIWSYPELKDREVPECLTAKGLGGRIDLDADNVDIWSYP